MSTKANTTSPASEKALGERAVDQILLAWKGDFAGDACIAATQIGLLHSGNMLGYDHAKTILKFHFGVRKVDDIHWSSRTTVAELCARERCSVRHASHPILSKQQ